MKLAEPYPEGTRVHHRGALYSIADEPAHPDGGLRGGWGIVRRSVEQRDGSFEYEIHADRGIAGELRRDPVTWWGSHHINEARACPEAEHEERLATGAGEGTGC